MNSPDFEVKIDTFANEIVNNFLRVISDDVN